MFILYICGGSTVKHNIDNKETVYRRMRNVAGGGDTLINDRSMIPMPYTIYGRTDTNTASLNVLINIISFPMI